MYSGLLHTHSFLRWVVLILALVAVVTYFMGWLGKKNYTRRDDSIGLFFVASMHTQLLIGLLLYFVFSPITKVAMSDMGAAMKDPVLRYWSVEHITGMVVAVILAQMGRTMSKRSLSHENKFKRGAIFYLLSLLVILAMIPWPWMANIGRSLMP